MNSNKIISVAEALAKIPDHAEIVTGLAASEPRSILAELHTVADRISRLEVTNCLPLLDAPYFCDASYKDKFFINSWFYTKSLRDHVSQGNISFLPNHLHLAATTRLHATKPTIYMGMATPPDKHGFLSLSLSNVYEQRMIQAADIVIIEINPKLPRTFGDVELHIDKVDYMVEVDYDIPTLPDIQPNERDITIGKHIAERINDGDCIQLGIGGIPNAVAAALGDKRNLGIHTEMLTTGMMDLVKKGVVNGTHKNFYPNKIVCAFALGTQELYDFIDDNPAVVIKDGHWVNDPYIIGQNDNQVSINTTIEVDLTGQCASESIGAVQYSGTGGQADTAIGAQRAKNGRSFIALYSTANVRVAPDQRQPISKIVSVLKQGAAVTLSRSDVDYVVTEYGVAELRGTTVRERAKRLIAIAHPDFRDELISQAKALGYLSAND